MPPNHTTATTPTEFATGCKLKRDVVCDADIRPWEFHTLPDAFRNSFISDFSNFDIRQLGEMQGIRDQHFKLLQSLTSDSDAFDAASALRLLRTHVEEMNILHFDEEALRVARLCRISNPILFYYFFDLIISNGLLTIANALGFVQRLLSVIPTAIAGRLALFEIAGDAFNSYRYEPISNGFEKTCLRLTKRSWSIHKSSRALLNLSRNDFLCIDQTRLSSEAITARLADLCGRPVSCEKALLNGELFFREKTKSCTYYLGRTIHERMIDPHAPNDAVVPDVSIETRPSLQFKLPYWPIDTSARPSPEKALNIFVGNTKHLPSLPNSSTDGQTSSMKRHVRKKKLFHRVSTNEGSLISPERALSIFLGKKPPPHEPG